MTSTATYSVTTFGHFPRQARGRLAPSPTGLLHLGNAWAFWVAWLGARAADGGCVLRLEDIDPARSRPEFAAAVEQDLAWLGLDWDEGPATHPDLCIQSRRFAVYDSALDALDRLGLLYPCYCTRKELRDLAGAPHIDEAGAPYPGTCRTLTQADRARLEALGRKPALRLACPPDIPWAFTDAALGERTMTLAQCGGDFAVRRSDGVYAYQLAVVVDDIAAGVTQVTRGRDIVASTPRQMYLYSLLGAPLPVYAHVPLITDEYGERLAKRHQSLTLAALRDAGVRPATLLGWLAGEAGLQSGQAALTAAEAVSLFAFDRIRPDDIRLPPDPVAFFLARQGG